MARAIEPYFVGAVKRVMHRDLVMVLSKEQGWAEFQAMERGNTAS